ncbi:MAG: AAA family ATPase [Magnetococcales bacterium]|nr:AAA family ATPase [Magnetococcales bacterium]
MKITELQTQNFHGFAAKELSLDPRFTLLVGNNASGKTSLLEALAVAMGGFLLGFPGIQGRSIGQEEVRRVVHVFDGLADLQPQYPAVVAARGQVADHAVSWRRGLYGPRGRTTRREAVELVALAEELRKAVAGGEQRPLPVLAYYGTQRLWRQKRELADMGPKIPGRLAGYRDCLDPASNHKHLTAWLRRQALIDAQRGQTSLHAHTIERVVLTFLEGARSFRYDLAREELVLEMDDGPLFTFDMLSDGYRNMLAMVADIAWRATVLNPFFGQEAPQRTTGLVLIDEIDLHLHPKWQRRVVGDLRTAFPNLQFVATTHSPFIIQSLWEGSLYNLDPDYKATLSHANASPEDIIEWIQGVPLPQRSQRRQEMVVAAEAYYRLLERIPAAPETELAALKQRLDELAEPFADDPAFVAFLRMERLAAEGRRP